MFDPKGYRRNLQEIDLNDNKRISYVEFALILFQQNLDMMRSEKPLANSKLKFKSNSKWIILYYKLLSRSWTI